MTIFLADAGSIATSVALFLIALAAALTFLFFGLKWIGRNEDQARAALSKVGITPLDPIVPISDPGDAPPPPTPLVTTPPQPIVLAVPTGGAPRLTSASRGVIDLAEGANLVSREAGAICLSGESTVSRRHAELVRTGDVVIVRDLGSTNGTFVNGARVSGDQSLRPGDRVRFGAVELQYEA